MALTPIIRAIAASSAISTPSPAATSAIVEKPLPSIGPIPLAAFIPMCLFAPFIISFPIYLFYTAIKGCKDKRRLKGEGQVQDPEEGKRIDVEKQVARFVQAPAPVKMNSLNGGRGGRGPDPGYGEKYGGYQSEAQGSPLRNQAYHNAYGY